MEKAEENLELIQKYPAINTLIQTGVTASMSGILDRLVELQSFSSEERFTRLLKRSPHLLQHIDGIDGELLAVECQV